MNTIECLGYQVYCENKIHIDPANNKTVINTINPHCYCEAKGDIQYRQALLDSDILLADGIGFVLAVRVLSGLRIRRIPGSDLHIAFLKQLNAMEGKVFYLGSSELTLRKIIARAGIEYQNVKIGTYSPPFKSEFSNEDNVTILDAINQFRPDVLFVGMTAPKQEKWVFENKDLINAPVICSIGAVFDFYAGTIKRPGKFWISIGLEWMPRLLREPRRLWPRTFISAPLFIWFVLIEKLRKKSV